MSNPTYGLVGHNRYHTLLFIFPAAAVVSHASAIFAHGISVFECFLLFILMYFVWIEYETSGQWLALETQVSDNVFQSTTRLSALLAIDFIRIFALLILYIAMLYGLTETRDLIPGRVQKDFDYLISSCCGLFLAMNGVWNIIVRPSHADVISSLNGSRHLIVRMYSRLDIKTWLLWMACNLFKHLLFGLFKAIFYAILPLCGIAILGMIFLEAFRGDAPSWIANAVIWMLAGQSCLKSIQYFVLSWTLQHMSSEQTAGTPIQ